VLGPDPEARAEYLIYLGGGQGEVFALDPQGRRRWSWDTLTLAGRPDYPNINASLALGQYGLATANANGDVFYIPYDYYLQPEAVGITRDPGDGFGEAEAAWHAVSPGGLVDKLPLPCADPGAVVLAHPGQVVTLRLLVRPEGGVAAARLEPGSVHLDASPGFSHRLEIMSDDQTVAIVPEEMLAPGQSYHLRLSADYTTAPGGREAARGQASALLTLSVAPAAGGNTLLQGKHPGFVITHMAFPQPAIIPSLDQIGIAIMRIPWVVVEADAAKGSFSGWAVQKYGEAAGGEEQGLPDSRTLFYAFSGETRGDYFTLESRNCFFEESSFPFPLDRLRLSGRVLEDGSVERGASLWAELDPPTIMEALSLLSVSAEEKTAGRQSWVSSSLAAGEDGDRKGILSAALTTGPTVAGYIHHRIWRPWRFYNHAGKLVASGTFRLAPLPAETVAAPAGLLVRRFEFDPRQREVIAEVEMSDPEAMVMVGILLVDADTGQPVPLNYNRAMRRYRLADGSRRTVLAMDLPASPRASLPSRNLRAHLMVDLFRAQTLEIKTSF
jgi:hypothetical protein